MFKDYTYSHEEVNGFYIAIITIIDDYFIETVRVEDRLTLANVTDAIIKIYSKTKLSVAQNIVLFISLWNKKVGWSITDILEYIDGYVSNFDMYKEEVEKLLLFN